MSGGGGQMTLVLMLKIAGMAACAGVGFRLGWIGVEVAVLMISYGVTHLIDAWNIRIKGEAK